MASIFRKRNLLIISTIGVVAFSGYLFFRPETPIDYEFVTIARGDLVQEVSVTGRVQPTDSVSLAFEKGGTVTQVHFDVNETIQGNQPLVTLDNSELSAIRAQAAAGVQGAQADVQNAIASLENARAQLKSAEAEKENVNSLKTQAEASLDSERARLAELKTGTREEEIKIAETKVANAKKSLTDAQTDLENTKSKTDRDTSTLLQTTNDVILSAITTGEKIFNQNLQDIIYPIRIPQSKTCQPQIIIRENENLARTECLKVLENFETLKESIDTISEKDQTKLIERLDEEKKFYTELRTFLALLLDILSGTSSTLRSSGVAITPEELTSLKNQITLAQTDTVNLISQLTNQIESLNSQDITNKTAIDNAQKKINDAQSALASAEDELTLKRAGATSEQLAAQEALVAKAVANLTSQEAKLRQAEANIESQKAQIAQAEATLNARNAQVAKAQADLQNIDAQIAKTILRSPIEGIVTKQDAKVGEIVPAGTAIAAVISKNKFEIEANIPEADIAKIKLGDHAKLTLDAYGDDEIFQATVAEIDPGETIIEGVTTYKITLAFNENDDRIKPSMTANLDIQTAEKKNTISVLQRSVITQNGTKFVRVLKKNGEKQEIEEVLVKTGLLGNDGYIEIVNGLKVGDQVVTFINE